MKIKTNELTGAALDWAVAKCWYGDEYDMSIPLFEDGKLFAPSTNWAHGGPIIGGERLSVVIQRGGDDPAWHTSCPRYLYHGYGSTPLIAAMRCYVASKLGNEVDVSDQLTETV